MSRGPGRPAGGIDTQLRRLLEVRRAFIVAAGHPLELNAIAARFDVTVRTVRRDIAVLVAIGEVAPVDGTAGKWRWVHWETTRRAFDLLLDRARTPAQRRAIASLVDLVRTLCREDALPAELLKAG